MMRGIDQPKSWAEITKNMPTGVWKVWSMFWIALTALKGFLSVNMTDEDRKKEERRTIPLVFRSGVRYY
jgi:hypothetical protein